MDTSEPSSPSQLQSSAPSFASSSASTIVPNLSGEFGGGLSDSTQSLSLVSGASSYRINKQLEPTAANNHNDNNSSPIAASMMAVGGGIAAQQQSRSVLDLLMLNGGDGDGESNQQQQKGGQQQQHSQLDLTAALALLAAQANNGAGKHSSIFTHAGNGNCFL